MPTDYTDFTDLCRRHIENWKLIIDRFFVYFIYTVYTKCHNEFVINGLENVYRCVYSCILVYT